MKRIWLLFILLFVFMLMMSCGGRKKSTEINESSCEVSYRSSLHVDKKKIHQNDVIDITQDALSASLHIDNMGAGLSVGLMLFSNGLPIQYEVEDMQYTYYSFTIDDKKIVDFTIMSDELPQGKSNLHVVLLLNDMYMMHNRNDEKNYSLDMSYVINNSSAFSSNNVDIMPYDGEIIEYDRLYKACLSQVNVSSSDYKYSYEKEALYNMISKHEVDICFSKPFDIDKSPNLSVLRNVVYNINASESQKVTIRMCGQAGEYYLTMFCNGQVYGAFNGQPSAKIVIEENAYTFIEVVLPSYANNAHSVVNGLMFDCNNQLESEALFDSGLLNVYYAESDIDFSFNQSQATLNLFYQNELITPEDEQIFDYDGEIIEARFMFNEYSTSYTTSYRLMVFANGMLQSFSVNGGETYQHSFEISRPFELAELHIALTPLFVEPCNDFVVQYVVVPKTISSSIAPPSNTDIRQCLMGEVHFRVSDQNKLNILKGVDAVNGQTYQPLESLGELSISIESKDAENSYVKNMVLLEHKGLQDINFSVVGQTNGINGTGVWAVMTNGRLVTYEGACFTSWISQNGKVDIPITIPKYELTYGMNEVNVFVSARNDVRMYRLVVVIYDETQTPFDYSIEEEDGLIRITAPKIETQGHVKVFCSSTGGECSYFGNFYECVTARSLFEGSNLPILIIGTREYDNRICVTTIITKYDYFEGEYVFSRIKTIGRVL